MLFPLNMSVFFLTVMLSILNCLYIDTKFHSLDLYTEVKVEENQKKLSQKLP